ncbi:S1 family peptidase [Vibrio nigripulchritudo]|uniref:S1 family peptidase n=1 Tax=Vibrio nigripulchritudo TaxID=28173 RepID=UPI00190B36F2|nr:serine protease [Vibrio nigripulchritudo]
MNSLKVKNAVLALGIISACSAASASEKPVRTSSQSERIIGGNKSANGDWPFMTALVAKGKDAFATQSCGGSFLGDRYVLTAAHCVNGVNPEELDAIVGVYDLKKASTEGVRLGVQSIYTHELFDTQNLNYDIAVLELERAINSDKVALATTSQEPTGGDSVTVIGWGNQQPNSNLRGIYPSELFEVDLPIVTRSICQTSGGRYQNINDAAICAGFSSGGKDSCQGDSGGPLIQDLNGIPTQVGVVSWGEGCAKPGKYGVYANVAHLNSWINDQMTGVSYRQNVYFGFNQVGTKLSKTVTVKNHELTPFNVSSVVSSDSNKLKITNNQCAIVGDLQQGESCDVTVELTVPLGRGEAEIVVNTNHATKNQLKTKLHSYGLIAVNNDVKSAVGLGDAVYSNATPWEVYLTDTLKAGDTPRGQSSLLRIENLKQGELTFDARVNTQSKSGYFKVLVNGRLVFEYTGYETNYFSYRAKLSGASNDVMFIYERGVTSYSDNDTVYLKNIKVKQTESGSSGGSLSLGWIMLLLPLALLRKRKSKQ